MVHSIGPLRPDIHPSVFVAWNAEVSGDVSLGENASVWFSATVRADVAAIRIGAGSNVQDGAVVHVDPGNPCIIGENVTIGHRAVLHGCTVGNGCLVGMGAIILDGARIGDESVVGAGALVTQGKSFPPRSLIVGSPGRALRTLTGEDVLAVAGNGAVYRKLAAEALSDYAEMKR